MRLKTCFFGCLLFLFFVLGDFGEFRKELGKRKKINQFKKSKNQKTLNFAKSRILDNIAGRTSCSTKLERLCKILEIVSKSSEDNSIGQEVGARKEEPILLLLLV